MAMDVCKAEEIQGKVLAKISKIQILKLKCFSLCITQLNSLFRGNQMSYLHARCVVNGVHL